MVPTPTIPPRFAIWLLLVTILTFSVLYSWQKIQVTTVETAYAVAAKRMLNKANFYKENWLIQKRPELMVIEDQPIQFNSHGWPLPLKNNVVDCEYWLWLLNENNDVFGHELTSVTMKNIENNYICRYSYNEGSGIILKLKDGNLSVSVDLLAAGMD